MCFDHCNIIDNVNKDALKWIKKSGVGEYGVDEACSE
jgi:hypothetical protein